MLDLSDPARIICSRPSWIHIDPVTLKLGIVMHHGTLKLGIVMHHGTLKLGIVMHHGTQDQSLYVEFPATVSGHSIYQDVCLSVCVSGHLNRFGLY